MAILNQNLGVMWYLEKFSCEYNSRNQTSINYMMRMTLTLEGGGYLADSFGVR